PERPLTLPLDADPRAERRAIDAFLFEPELEPVLARGLIQKHHGRSVVDRHDDVGVAVVVEIAERGRAIYRFARKCWTRPARYIAELAVAQVVEQEVLHPQRHRLAALPLDQIDGAVGGEQIEPSVVVVVDPAGTEAGERRRGLRQAGAYPHVLEVA